MNDRIPDKVILIYRIVFVCLSWFTIITGAILSAIANSSILPWFNGFKYYTMQTNIAVTIWFMVAIFLYNKPESLKKISGLLKGALTLYITTTFIFFAILLQFLYHPTGWAAFTNIILHYIIPIAFIVDWILTETKLRYKWKYLPYWIIYPLCYLLFSFIHGTFTGDYLYPFLNISKIGNLWYTISICFLVGVGIVLGCIYIVINRIRVKY